MKWNDKNEIWTDNAIGDEGARMISESLKTNTTLTILYLGGDEIEVKMKTKHTQTQTNNEQRVSQSQNPVHEKKKIFV